MQSVVKKPFAWRVAGVLAALGLLCLLGSAPFLLPLLRTLMARVPGPAPLPLPVLLALGLLQQALLVVVFTGVGLMLAGKIGLGAPLIEGWLAGIRPKTPLWSSFRLPVLAGLGVGIVLGVLMLFWFVPQLPQLPIVTAAKLPVWQRIGACFGGIDEELIMRLFLMSLLAWLLGKVWRQEDGMPAPLAMWLANGATAILFGLGHLPSASLFMTITPLVVAAALLLNGIAGLVFGWLYWRRGIEAAMVAHFFCGFVVWVIAPVFISR